MSELFHLLQGQIECWDGVRDHALMEGGKTWMVIRNRKVSVVFFWSDVLQSSVSCPYLRRGVCGRGHERGIG